MKQARTLKEATKVYSATEARNHLGDLINEALYQGPVFVRKHKHEVAIISADLFRTLTEAEALLESEEAKKAFEEFVAKGGVTLDELKEELDLD